jgi:hypothetical protein
MAILRREVASLRALLQPKPVAIDSEAVAAREAAKQKRIEDREAAKREHAEAAAKEALLRPERDRKRAEWEAKDAARKRDLARVNDQKWCAANPEKAKARRDLARVRAQKCRAANPEKAKANSDLHSETQGENGRPKASPGWTRIARRGVAMRGKGKDTLALIAAIKEILEEIQPASVRAVCYRLFVRQLIKSMAKNEVDRVGDQLVYAREEGIVPWAWVVDETRSVERVECWRDLEHHLDDFCKEHLKDPWDDQPERLVVVSEKGTIRGTLMPVLQELRVRFLVSHGFASATAACNLAQTSMQHDRTTRAIYVGDYDPSGLHMSEIDLPRRLKRYGGDVQITRVAITEDDVRHSSLPDFPASDKGKDSRYRWFSENHGSRCIEVDAMPPPELRERVRKAILAHIDGDAWERSLEIEQEELAEIGDWKARIMGAP